MRRSPARSSITLVRSPGNRISAWRNVDVNWSSPSSLRQMWIHFILTAETIDTGAGLSGTVHLSWHAPVPESSRSGPVLWMFKASSPSERALDSTSLSSSEKVSAGWISPYHLPLELRDGRSLAVVEGEVHGEFGHAPDPLAVVEVGDRQATARQPGRRR